MIREDVEMDDRRSLFDGDTGEKIEARLLMHSVQGDEYPVAYALRGGRPTINAAGVELGAPVNPQLLVDFLRSDRPLNRDIRNWLADMLDPAVHTTANLRLSPRAGNRKTSMLQYQYAVEAYLERREAGDGYDAAIAEVASAFGMKLSLLKKAVTRIGEGVEIHRESQRRPLTSR